MPELARRSPGAAPVTRRVEGVEGIRGDLVGKAGMVGEVPGGLDVLARWSGVGIRRLFEARGMHEDLPRCPGPVSYTHLDVYKRQPPKPCATCRSA